MKAWRFTAPGEPISHEDVPEPTAGPGWVVVEVKGSGLCHTDVGFLDGSIDAGLLAEIPMTLGHEIAGVITEVGEGVSDLAVGDSVGLRSGAFGPSFAYQGGFAPYLAAPVEHVAKAPEGVPFSHLAVGGDAGMIAYHAVAVKGGAAPGLRMGIIGLGGLGISGLQIAKRLGAEVYAAEPRTVLHEKAPGWGATEVFEDARSFAGLDLDVICDFAGFESTVQAAVETVREEGTVILIGAGQPQATIKTGHLTRYKVTLRGHQGATTEDLQAYWRLLEEGLDPVVTEIGFDEIGEGLERLRRHEILGRLVAVPRG
ncbi:alcohol dehydrogenase catalytic domain-containing protein [Nocardioides acrostichi]|uniref:Alcohol dehydrogenase catalytic domain-containing protein n=1 Tax=Nocardioides acrostichi TaxID=2784339 RepID=A0A930YE95_9ACTN|nr:alcohol dehydrogenase catalytic domain-containing protein [Nocardioides acrostichi]MBF4163284.1 alcohol dehydrogenase catalytic domain-containing protein [Nocardioides acrostichi]